jgi:hypothetical protein
VLDCLVGVVRFPVKPFRTRKSFVQDSVSSLLFLILTHALLLILIKVETEDLKVLTKDQLIQNHFSIASFLSLSHICFTFQLALRAFVLSVHSMTFEFLFT